MNPAKANCMAKRAYPDKRAAQTVLNQAMRLRHQRGRAAKLRIYPCPHCRAWHLTKVGEES